MNEGEICPESFLNLGLFLYENGKKVSEYENLMKKFNLLENSFISNEKNLLELLEINKNLKDKIYDLEFNSKSNNTKTFLYEYYSKNNLPNKSNQILTKDYHLIHDKIFAANQVKNKLLKEIKEISIKINELNKEIEY